MKTIKIILGMAGLVLGTFCFGQLPNESSKDLLFYSSYYNLTSMRVEHQLSHYPIRSVSGDHFEAPLLNKTYFVSMKSDLEVEDWMTAPFESTFYEEELLLESWMLSPFKNSYTEEELNIEPWMTKPFGPDGMSEDVIEEEIKIEDWMTTSWI